MQLTYVGPHDAVDVPLKRGGKVTVKRDESESIPSEIAESLLEQGDSHWVATKPPAAPKASPTPKES